MIFNIVIAFVLIFIGHKTRNIELANEGPITFKLITKKPIRPKKQEIINNPRSRSAKLRIGEKIN